MPANTKYVGRGSIYGNPYKVTSIISAKIAVQKYENWLDHQVQTNTFFRVALKELKGKNLACWCLLDQPCHADVLLEIANK